MFTTNCATAVRIYRKVQSRILVKLVRKAIEILIPTAEPIVPISNDIDRREGIEIEDSQGLALSIGCPLR